MQKKKKRKNMGNYWSIQMHNYSESLLKTSHPLLPIIYCLFSSLNLLLKTDASSLIYIYLQFSHPLKRQVIPPNFLQFSQLLRKGSLFFWRVQSFLHVYITLLEWVVEPLMRWMFRTTAHKHWEPSIRFLKLDFALSCT